ncbi:hypothetical protein INT43_004186 [Umbelopsis isabellina]|uniref:Protein kinase domain-containing protein n=1 Tax=Mortierella isabellina TaxID=91625 RepID=A0A8H7PJ08_MORIS|nr:hypothetical protein INT43_004186 [Umbelopsis isabellina]
MSQTLFYICLNVNTTSGTTFTTDSWLTTPLQTNQSLSNSASLAQIALDVGQAQAGNAITTSSFTSINSASKTSSRSSTSYSPRPQISASSQSQSCTNQQCTANTTTALTGTLIATKSYLLLLGWPQADNAFYANVSIADYNSYTTDASQELDFSPVSNNVSFSSGTGTGIEEDKFVYLKYGANPELLYFTIDPSGSINLDKSVAVNGSNWVTGDVVFMPNTFTISNETAAMKKRTEPLSLMISGMDSNQNTFVLATNSNNPTDFLSLNNGDNLRATPSATSSPILGTLNKSAHASTNIGAIVGGVIGGLAAVAICIGLFFFLRRRSRRTKLQRHIDELRNSNNRSHFDDLIDERPVHNARRGDATKQDDLPMSESSALQAAILARPLPTLVLPTLNSLPGPSSNSFLADYSHNIQQDTNVDISDYTGADLKRLQKDLKAGETVLEDNYVLTAEPPVKVSQYYTVRTASSLSDKTKQVSLHLFKDTALDQQKALVTFSGLLDGKHTINHIQSYKLPGGGTEEYSAITVTEACSHMKSLASLLHPAQGGHALVDSTDPYFQRLTINSLLQALQHLHQQGISHADLSTHSFFHEGGCVTEWKLGNLEKCRTTGHRVEESNFVSITAPEILTGEELNITKASDIWSLGLTIYEIISGNVFFSSLQTARVFAYTEEGVYLDGFADERAQRLLSRMLSLNPKHRDNIEELMRLWEEGDERHIHNDDEDDDFSIA